MVSSNSTLAHVRPNDAVLHHFWCLSRSSAKERCRTAMELLKEIRNKPDILPYCLSRLLAGLASTHSFARHGFSTALCLLIEQLTELPLCDVFLQCTTTLALTGDEIANNVIGRALMLAGVAKCERVSSCIQRYMQEWSQVLAIKKSVWLEQIYIKCVVLISGRLDKAAFTEQVYPFIKTSYCKTDWANCNANTLWLLLELQTLFPDYMNKHAPILRSFASIEADNVPYVVDVMLETNRSCPTLHPVNRCIMRQVFASTPETLKHIWSTIIVEKFLKNEDRRVTAFGLDLFGQVLDFCVLEEHGKVVFSKKVWTQLLQIALGAKSHNFLRGSLVEFSDRLESWGKRHSTNPKLQLIVLRNLYAVSLTFDQLTNCSLERVFVRTLSDHAVSLYVNLLVDHLRTQLNAEVLSAVNLSVLANRLKTAMATAGKDGRVKELVATALCSLAYGKGGETFVLSDSSLLVLPKQWRSQHALLRNVHDAWLKCLQSFCIVCTTPGRLKFTLPADNEALLVRLLQFLLQYRQQFACNLTAEANSAVEKVVDICSQFQTQSSDVQNGTHLAFRVLLPFVAVWTLDQPKEFDSIVDDVVVCFQQATGVGKKKSKGPGWLDVLIDLFLSILTKNFSVARQPLQVALHHLCPLLDFEHLKPLLAALDPSKSADSFFATENDEDDADATDNGEETEDAPDQETSSDENSDVEDNAAQYVNPQLKEAVRSALGNAALSDADEKEPDTSSDDLDDEAMMRLDESLSMAFRKHISAKHSKAETKQQLAHIRLRIFDLIDAIVHSNVATMVLVRLIVPLLQCANAALKTSDMDFYRKVHEVLPVILKMKNIKLAPDDGQLIMGELEQFVQVARSVTNPVLQLDVGGAMRFYLKLLFDYVEQKDPRAIVKWYEPLVKEFLQVRGSMLPTSMFRAAFEQYPKQFCPLLGVLGRAIAGENDVRIFRRMEACQLAIYLVKAVGDQLSVHRVHKAWNKFTTRLAKCVETVFSGVVDKTKADMHTTETLKPNFIAALTLLLRAVALTSLDVPLGPLQQEEWLAVYLVPLSHAKIWKAEPLIKVANPVAQACHRGTVQSVYGNIVEGIRKRTVEEGKTAVEPSLLKKARGEDEGSMEPSPKKTKVNVE